MCHSRNTETRVQDDNAEPVTWPVGNSAEAGVLDCAHSKDGLRNWNMAGDRAWLTTVSLCYSPSSWR